METPLALVECPWPKHGPKESLWAQTQDATRQSEGPAQLPPSQAETWSASHGGRRDQQHCHEKAIRASAGCTGTQRSSTEACTIQACTINEGTGRHGKTRIDIGKTREDTGRHGKAREDMGRHGKARASRGSSRGFSRGSNINPA